MNVKEYMVKKAKEIAADNRYGYSNAWPNNRFGIDATPYDGDCGAFCSYVLNDALAQIGVYTNEYYEPIGNYQLYNEAYLLRYCNRYPYENIRNAPGDILTNYGHTVMVTSIDPDYITHASNDYDGRSGDSSGLEIRTQAIYNGSWKWIYRLKDEYNKDIPSIKPIDPKPEPEPPKKQYFEDVDISNKYIQWAGETGVAKGSKGKFYPKRTCTRGEFMTFFWRMIGKPEPLSVDSSFLDVNEDKYYAKAIQWGYEQGIVVGDMVKEMFYPANNITRVQAAIILWKWQKKPKVSWTKLPFSDMETLSKNMKKAIVWCASKGIVKGYKDSTFRPDDGLTREQAIIILYRLNEYLNK